jgi:hypothetical protein
MWQRIAALRQFDIPGEQLEQIVPLLETLFQQVRQALDHDLSTTDPALTFRCYGATPFDGEVENG